MMWDLSGGAQQNEYPEYRHRSHSHTRSRSHSHNYGTPPFPVPQTGSHSPVYRQPSPCPMGGGFPRAHSSQGYVAEPGPFLTVPSAGHRGMSYSTTAPPPRQRHNSTSALHPPKLTHHRHHNSVSFALPSAADHNRPGHSRHRSHSPNPAPYGHMIAPPPVHPMFQYSACTGRKKALCIGINYKGQPHELRGCINDARNVRSFLIRHAGYKEGDIVLLSDDHGRGSRQLPTKANIIDGMRWLVQGARPNDSLFFHFSGHGGQTRDRDGDEVDGYDEVIFPLDFQTRGHIVDDLMHAIMVKPLPPGCRLTALFDSCHSGTALDLPYVYSSSGRLRGSGVTRRARELKSTPADVISWAGCKDSQSSADTFANGQSVGAMSYAFMNCLKQNPGASYQQLLLEIRDVLKKKYSQKPQFGSSHPIDMRRKFIL